MNFRDPTYRERTRRVSFDLLLTPSYFMVHRSNNLGEGGGEDVGIFVFKSLKIEKCSIRSIPRKFKTCFAWYSPIWIEEKGTSRKYQERQKRLHELTDMAISDLSCYIKSPASCRDFGAVFPTGPSRNTQIYFHRGSMENTVLSTFSDNAPCYTEGGGRAARWAWARGDSPSGTWTFHGSEGALKARWL